MPDLREKPTSEQIEQEADHLGEKWSKARAKWRTVDSYYNREFGLWPDNKKEREEYHPSTPTNIIDTAVDQNLGWLPRVRRNPDGDTAEAREKTDRVERSVRELLNDSASHEMVIPAKASARNFMHYGYTPVSGPYLDLSDAQEEPVQEDDEDDEDFKRRTGLYKGHKRHWNPFKMRAIHPSRVLLDPSEKQPKIAIFTALRFGKDLEEMTLKKKSLLHKLVDIFRPKKGKGYEEHMVLDYWTPFWHAMKVVGGQNLIVEPNPWGFVPAAHSFAGFGQERTDVKGVDPSALAVGLLDSVMESLKLSAQQQSAFHTLLLKAAYTQILSPVEAAEARSLLESEIIRTPDPKLWGVMPTPEVTGWMLSIGAGVNDDIEKGTFTGALSGHKEQGVNTVGQQQILSDAARLKFAGPSIQNESLWTIMGTKLVQLADVYGKNIRINGHELRIADIEHFWPVAVTFPVLNLQADLQHEERGLRKLELKVLDRRTFHEDYETPRVDNVTERQDRLLQDAVDEHPAVLAERVAEYAKGVGEMEAEAIRKFNEQEFADASAQNESSAIPLATEQAAEVPVTGDAQASRPLRESLDDVTTKRGRDSA